MRLQQTRHLLTLGIAVAMLSLSAQVAAQMPAQADRADFDLVCVGMGEHLAGHNTYSYEWDDKQHKYVDKTGVQYSQEQSQATMQVEIHGGEGRIRPPRSMAPPLHSGGSGGWYPLRDLNVSPDRIQASFRFNGMNVPTIEINRRSGFMTMRGSETFEGNCTAVNPDENRF